MTRYILALIYVVGAALGKPTGEDALVVKLPQGSVKGYKEVGQNYFAFYGIPYATAPKGSDKFKVSTSCN